MNICIVGGGNLAHAYAGELARTDSNNTVSILTRRPQLWSDNLSVYYNHTFHHSAKIKNLSKEVDIVRKADVIVFALPVFCRFSCLKVLREYISRNTILITSPSNAGINIYFDRYLPENQYVCLQRVPYICRIVKYGRSVNTEKKQSVEVFFSKNSTNETEEIVQSLLEIELFKLKSFYPLMLSNSNPILHPAGICDLLRQDLDTFKLTPFFYDIWTDYASEKALKMDCELTHVMKQLKVREYHTLMSYYKVNSKETLTNKLKAIRSFKQIQAPIVSYHGKLTLDTRSRYLIEDIPFGTCYIKLFAQFLGIQTPEIDDTIKKLQVYLNKTFVNDMGELDIDALKNELGFLPISDLLQTL